MDEEFLDRFLEYLEVIVSADGTWREKKALLMARAEEDDKLNLDEFASWFDKPEEGQA